MIYLYTGPMGCGKTLNAIEIICAYLARGSVVTTNIEMNFEKTKAYCLAKFGVVIQPAALIRLDDKKTHEAHKHVVPGTQARFNLLVIDECTLFFPSRGYKENEAKAKEFLSFCVMSRHLAVDCIFIIQHTNNLDAQIRRVAQFEVLFRDLRKYPIPWLGVRPFAWIHMIAVGTFEVGQRDPIDRRIFVVDTRLYHLYDTTEIKTPFEMATVEPVTPSRKVVIGRYVEKYLKTVLLLCGLAYMVGCTYYDKANYEQWTNSTEKLYHKLEKLQNAPKNDIKKETPDADKPMPKRCTAYCLKQNETVSACIDGVWYNSGSLYEGGVYLTYDTDRGGVRFIVGGKIVLESVPYERKVENSLPRYNGVLSRKE